MNDKITPVWTGRVKLPDAIVVDKCCDNNTEMKELMRLELKQDITQMKHETYKQITFTRPETLGYPSGVEESAQEIETSHREKPVEPIFVNQSAHAISLEQAIS